MNLSSTTQSTSQSSMPPLGGTNGNWSYRILHFHIPLALASAVIIFLWMNLPLFQAAGHQGSAQMGQMGTSASSHQGSSQAGDQITGHQSSPQTGNPANSHQGSAQADGATPMEHSGNQASNADDTQNRLAIGRFTTATGYVALVLLALTLLIGPANLLLRRRTPISSYLTRDVGTWATIISVIHVIAGFFVHGPPAPLGERIRVYFFALDGSLLTNTFGLANWTGIAATVIVVGLLSISNDFALRKLKAKRWKNLQRLNYGLFVLVILHAIYYGALLRVTSPSTILLGLAVSAVFIGQMVGIRLWRQRRARGTRERQSANATL